MSYVKLLIKRCAIQERGAGDDDTGEFATVTGLESVACRLANAAGEEKVEGMTITTTRKRLFLPAGTAITARSRVVVEGQSYNVVAVNAGPGGKAHHIECDVEVNE